MNKDDGNVDNAHVESGAERQPTTSGASLTANDDLGDQRSTQLDFAQMVRTNCNNYQNSDNFTTVANKKKRSRKLVVSNAASDVSFKGVSRKSVVCVSRLG